MKENNISRYHQLAEKWMNGNITSDEQEEFAIWYAKDQSEPVEVDAAFASSETIQRNRMMAKVMWYHTKPKTRLRKLYQWSAAAAILIFIAGGLWITHKQGNHTIQYSNDVQPGKQQAVLILSDGQRINLDGAKQGELAKQTGATILKNEKGEIVYLFNPNSAANNDLNTIETPLAGQYQVILPDETKVWLNAGSSITFPTTFAGHLNREVNVKGEAYFEVTHHKNQPFLVKTADQQIKVLGTHFNVKAYANDNAVITTLLQGSIAINNNTILKPNDQAVNNGKLISVSGVDPEYAIAWKEGKFRFHNMNITELMKDVARWYNVDIVYEDNMEDKEFSGVVSRFDNISTLLSVLESTNTIHFKIEGRRITVMR